VRTKPTVLLVLLLSVTYVSPSAPLHLRPHGANANAFIIIMMTTIIRPITRYRVSTSSSSNRWHFAFTLCCQCNETRVSIANPPNNTQLGAPYNSPKLHPGPCSSGHAATDRHTHRSAWPIYISRRLRLTRNVVSSSSLSLSSSLLVYYMHYNWHAGSKTLLHQILQLLTGDAV